jgi:hypothetical protein
MLRLARRAAEIKWETIPFDKLNESLFTENAVEPGNMKLDAPRMSIVWSKYRRDTIAHCIFKRAAGSYGRLERDGNLTVFGAIWPSSIAKP